jgi:tripartite-type tricarboxylate transporter receptor subunit TctC
VYQTMPGGGAGGAAIKYLYGLTPGNTLSVIVGGGGAPDPYGGAQAGFAGLVLF